MLFCRILENVAVYALKYKAVKGGKGGGSPGRFDSGQRFDGIFEGLPKGRYPIKGRLSFGAQWANPGGPAQIKEFLELASYTPNNFF